MRPRTGVTQSLPKPGKPTPKTQHNRSRNELQIRPKSGTASTRGSLKGMRITFDVGWIVTMLGNPRQTFLLTSHSWWSTIWQCHILNRNSPIVN